MDSLRLHRRSPFLHSEDGSITIEFAMAVPVVLLFVIGSMVTMVGLLAFGNETFATGLGARYAALHSSASDTPATSQSVTTQVQSHLWNGGGSGTQVTTAWSAGNVPGSTVTVTTTFTLPLGIPFTGVSQMTISATSVRVITR